MWIEIVLFVEWSNTDNGKISTYYRYSDEQNYHQINDVKGKNLQDPSRNSYIKFGIYKPENFPPELPPTAAQILDVGNISVFLPSN